MKLLPIILMWHSPISLQINAALLGAGLVLPIVFYLAFPAVTKEILKDLRIPRILHYVALAGLGVSLFLRSQSSLLPYMNWEYVLHFGHMVLALTYAAVFAIVTNNIEDIEADKITNPGRPLPRKAVSPRTYLMSGFVCQAIALLFTALVHPVLFWGILAVSIGYLIYSCRPLRLKRIPIVSKLLIGLNSLAVAVTGYAITGGEAITFPVEWAIFIVLPLSLAANFVDLKDIEGDRKTGIATLPVLLGQKKSIILIAIFTAAAWLMAGWLLGIFWLAPIIALMAIAHIWLLFRQPYQEKWIFFIYVSGIFGLDVFLLLPF